MFMYDYGVKTSVATSKKINVASFIKESSRPLKDFYKNTNNQELDLNREEHIKDFIRLVQQNVTVNLTQQNGLKVEQTSILNKVNLTYTKSNLGSGYVFWFVCSGCNNKVRHLYFPPYSEHMLCRKCHRLRYN